ncbi:MAG: signal peptidase II [Opitutus sp.]|nr:signal peptidase II [Opitutus sp.]
MADFGLKPDHPISTSASASAAVPQSVARNPPSKIDRVFAYRRLWVVAFVVYVLDQLTKTLIAAKLPFPTYGPPRHIVIVEDFFNLVHVGNTGAAWSILSGRGPWLAGLAILTLVAIYFWRHSLGLRSPFAQLCFGGLCGGTAGNLTDRILHGHVIDFLDFHFGSYIYPSFNVADMGIVCGVFGYIVWSLKQPAEPVGEK